MDTTDNKDLCEDRTPSEVIERVNALPLSWHNKIALVSSLVRDNMQMDEFGFAAELVEAARGLTEEREACMSLKFAAPYGKDPWSSDPDYPREDWQEEASEGSTQLGYWDWVSHQREADA